MRRFHDFFRPMANAGKKLKLPHSLADIQSLEDGIAEISEVLRDMRREMKEKGVAEVEIMSGTFKLHMRELQAIAIDFRAEVGKQRARNIARRIQGETAKKHT